MHNGRLTFVQPALELVVSVKISEISPELREVEFVKEEGDLISFNEIFQLVRNSFD